MQSVFYIFVNKMAIFPAHAVGTIVLKGLSVYRRRHKAFDCTSLFEVFLIPVNAVSSWLQILTAAASVRHFCRILLQTETKF